MSYIGKSPSGSGVRTRYYFTQSSGGGTSISGTDDNGKTLTYTDGEYVDVYLNGVSLVHGTDYGTGTANTISSLAALASGDVVEVVVYDIFNVAKINNEAVRKRYYKTASGSETSISGADDSGATITFAANAEIEVKLNGVALVQGTDYNTTSANTVGGLSALSAGQVVEVVVYERFVLGDTVSKADGGTFASAVAFSDGVTIDDDGATVLTLDRATSNGNVAEFQKDGTTVGAIGIANGDNLYISSDDTNDVGIKFNGDGNRITPCDVSGADRDNLIDLGEGSARYKDFYLGGNLYIGGTGSANALDDYEEGTWTPTWGVASGSITAHSNSSGRYTKIGRMVYIQGYISYQSNSSASGNVTVEGLPFTSVSSGFGQSNNQAGGVASTVNSLWTNDSPDSGRIPAGTTQILPMVNDNTQGTQIQFNDFSTGGNHSQFVFFGHYYI
ncbi:MAG: hypothetical protein ACPF8W_06675 [Luminiphilus sp.]